MSPEVELAVDRESPDTKELGAYYTPASVVDWLVDWATRDGRDHASVLDPSCGDGRFLERIPDSVGVDIDPDAISAAASRLSFPQLVKTDFFEWASSADRRFDAVLGNPPFIRYQRFKGRARDNALSYCRAHGVELSGLSSSWAPFVVGASTLLKPGGR